MPGFLEGAKEGITQAIPLVMQKRRLDQAEEQFNKTMDLSRAKLTLEAETKANEVAEKQLQNNIIAAIGEIESQAPAGIRPDLDIGELTGMGLNLDNAKKYLDAQNIQSPEEALTDKVLLQQVKNQGKKDGSAATPTDIDDFVADAEVIYLDKNPTAKPAEISKMRNKARLQFKRAQAREVEANRFALREVDAKTAEKIKYNEGIGKALAEIETAAEILEAKGEVTPQDKINNAKIRMSGNLATLANHYVTLDSTGGMLNVDNSTTKNIFAAARSSKVGQAFGRITGTNEQSIRSSINKIKPLLIQDIRQSTDMGARGLDSEKELEFYLQAATDEKTDIQSNIAAIVVLDEAFGEGKISAELRSLTDPSLIKRISAQGTDILNRRKTPSPKKKSKATTKPKRVRFDAQGNQIK